LPVAKRELSQAGPAKTRSRHFSYLNNALNIATKANVLAANPLEGLEPFRVKRKSKVEILTPEEMKAFLSALDRDWLLERPNYQKALVNVYLPMKVWWMLS
jgi:integrase